jgi:hypothetical protein
MKIVKLLIVALFLCWVGVAKGMRGYGMQEERRPLGWDYSNTTLLQFAEAWLDMLGYDDKTAAPLLKKVEELPDARVLLTSLSKDYVLPDYIVTKEDGSPITVGELLGDQAESTSLAKYLVPTEPIEIREDLEDKMRRAEEEDDEFAKLLWTSLPEEGEEPRTFVPKPVPFTKRSDSKRTISGLALAGSELQERGGAKKAPLRRVASEPALEKLEQVEKRPRVESPRSPVPVISGRSSGISTGYSSASDFFKSLSTEDFLADEEAAERQANPLGQALETLKAKLLELAEKLVASQSTEITGTE